MQSIWLDAFSRGLETSPGLLLRPELFLPSFATVKQKWRASGSSRRAILGLFLLAQLPRTIQQSTQAR